MGSGTTAVASINTNRKYIGFEKDEEYYNIAIKRVEGVLMGDSLF
jgi:site-specific DNA-methyltransferase (adenine-specific)